MSEQLQRLALWNPRPDAPAVYPLSDLVTLYGLPVMKMSVLAFSKANKQVIADADACLFISHYAVEYGVSQLSAEFFANKMIFAIGQRTASALQGYGLNTDLVAPAPFSSESMFEALAKRAFDFDALTIICGCGGRQWLQDQLVQQGKKVDRIACYRRDKCDFTRKDMVKFYQSYSINGLIVTSCAIADSVISRLRQHDEIHLFDAPVFVFGQRIAEYVRSQGFSQVIIADSANQQSLNQTILAWWENRVA